MHKIRLSLFGHPSIQRDGDLVAVDTRKAIALLAYLACKRQPQSRDSLAALLWSEYDTESARGALRRTLSTLRSAIGDECIQADRRTVRLRVENLEIDTDRVHKALRQSESHGHDAGDPCPNCLPFLQEALEVARGDFLEGFFVRSAPAFDDWQVMEGEDLRRKVISLLKGAAATHAEAGAFDKAVHYTRRWLALDPLDEAAHRALMHYYSSGGQRAAALKQYTECAQILEEELAVEPIEETRELYERIKDGVELGVAEPAASDISTEVVQRLPFVGRTLEWSVLLHELQGMHRQGRVIVLEGEAGIGKTRLLGEFMAEAARRGYEVASARCYEGESYVPYAPIAQLLRRSMEIASKRGAQSEPHASELSRLLSELGDARQPHSFTATTFPIDEAAARTRFLDAVVQTLVAPAERLPLVLAIDDLQWADESSRECLLYLMRRLGNLPVALVLAWRTEGGAGTSLLRRTALDAERHGFGKLLTLGRLDRDAIQTLLVSLNAEGASLLGSETSGWLLRETEGLPLFLHEYLLAMRTGGDLEILPRGVRELLEAKLLGLSATGRQFLTTAAVIGRSFDFETLWRASGRSEEMAIEGLEELVGQGLVQPTDEPTHAMSYDFAHDKLRDVVYEVASAPRRRLLHRRVADHLALAGERSGNDELSAATARHYRAGGQERLAALYFWRAGKRAQRLFANQDARAHFKAALSLGYEDVTQLQESIGDVETVLADYRAAAVAYEIASSGASGEDLARLETKLGIVYDRWGEWDLAENHFKSALAAVSSDQLNGRANVLAYRAIARHHAGDDQSAEEWAREALACSDPSDDEGQSRVHNVIGVVESALGHDKSAVDHLHESLRRAEKLPDPSARIGALHNLALVAAGSGAVPDGVRLARVALDLCLQQGDRHREAALRNTIADLLHRSGDKLGAMSELKKSVAIYADIGVDEGHIRTEVWKLSEW